MKGYTTREVAEVLGLSVSTIQGWTRSGLLTPERGPRGAYLFSFQDIVLLRTARELLAQDLSKRRVREALQALREQLPVGRPLSAVQVSALGDQVLVHDGDALWEPGSGQLQIDFAVAELAEQTLSVAAHAMEAEGRDADMTADDWYDTALDLEAVSVEQAIEAYRRALALSEEHADAHLNLGRLLHEGGDISAAEKHYRAAAGNDPESSRARFNLGVALEDQGRAAEAIEAYRQAVGLESTLAVAHFNLARLLEASGEPTEAIRHLADYKKLIERGA